MSEDVVKQLHRLSIGDHADNDASPKPPSQNHAVAGLDFALASLRELIGEQANSGLILAIMATRLCICLFSANLLKAFQATDLWSH